MSDFYNWAASLPRADRVEASIELGGLLAKGLAAGDVTAFESALAAWRSTGAVYHDPEVLDVLTRDLAADDLVEAERPRQPLARLVESLDEEFGPANPALVGDLRNVFPEGPKK